MSDGSKSRGMPIDLNKTYNCTSILCCNNQVTIPIRKRILLNNRTVVPPPLHFNSFFVSTSVPTKLLIAKEPLLPHFLLLLPITAPPRGRSPRVLPGYTPPSSSHPPEPSFSPKNNWPTLAPAITDKGRSGPHGGGDGDD